MADGICGSNKKDNSYGSQGNNTRLLNYRSVFREDSAVRLRGFNENYVNDDNLKWGWTVNNMSITLTVVTLDYRIKCALSMFLPLAFFQHFCR